MHHRYYERNAWDSATPFSDGPTPPSTYEKIILMRLRLREAGLPAHPHSIYQSRFYIKMCSHCQRLDEIKRVKVRYPNVPFRWTINHSKKITAQMEISKPAMVTTSKFFKTNHNSRTRAQARLGGFWYDSLHEYHTATVTPTSAIF